MPLTVTLSEIREERKLLIPTRLLTFEEFIQLFSEDDDFGLVDGMGCREGQQKMGCY